MTDRNKVYYAIDEERDYQDALWSGTSSAGIHGVSEFLLYIRDYVEEALHVQCREADAVAIEKGLHSLRKIAALAVAAQEQNGVRKKGYVTPTRSDLDKHKIGPL